VGRYRIEQAAGVCGHARGAGDGVGPGEGLAGFRGLGRVAGGRGEPAQRQCPGLQRGDVAVREGQQRVGGADRVAERPYALLGPVQLEQGQSLQQPHGWFFGRVREFLPRGRCDQCRCRII
jgi:hypothetical protein